jgi:hypothetical protein
MILDCWISDRSSDKSPKRQIGDISLSFDLKPCIQGFFDPKQFEGMRNTVPLANHRMKQISHATSLRVLTGYAKASPARHFASLRCSESAYPNSLAIPKTNL